MKEIILTTKIKREKQFYYYTGTDDNGNITLIKISRPEKKSNKEEYKQTTNFKPIEKEHLDFKSEEADIIDWDE